MSRINYDLTLIRGVVFDIDGVLSPSTMPTSPEGKPIRMANVKDGYALQLAVKLGLHVAILTGADCDAIKTRYESLGIHDVYTRACHKAPVLTQWMAEHDLRPEEVAYVGDDIPDYQAMTMVGLSVAPLDAAVDIKAMARYIAPVNGGYGVARDLIEQVLRAQDLWHINDTALIW